MKLFFLLISLSFFAPVPAEAGELAEPVTARLHSIQADFLQEKHLKILTRPIISTGTFAFQAPQSLRWEYRKPIPSLLLMHGGKMKRFVERDGLLVEDKRIQPDAMQVVLAEISNWLDGRFTDNEMFKVALPDKQTILLTPKGQGLAALISRIELKLADQGGLLDEVTIFEGPESYTRLTFRKRLRNQEIPVSLFTDK